MLFEELQLSKINSPQPQAAFCVDAHPKAWSDLQPTWRIIPGLGSAVRITPKLRVIKRPFGRGPSNNDYQPLTRPGMIFHPG